MICNPDPLSIWIFNPPGNNELNRNSACGNKTATSSLYFLLMMIKNDIQNSVAFTGKERDVETGYGYFGARYMDHELMTMWLSVDPLADKYPSISPYAYCAWNPVKLVDPDGQDISGIKPPRHGIRLEMGKISAQIGLVAGIGFSAYSGVARDQVGIVQFKCAKGDVCAPKKTPRGSAFF